MSKTVAMYPVVGAVRGANRILGPDRQWQPTNESQRRFVDEHFIPCGREVEHIKEIETLASYSANEINEFLRKRGFSIQLQPFKPLEFGVASVLDLLVEWIQEGKQRDIRVNGRTYPGVRIAGRGVNFFAVPSHPNPIACLRTKSADAVYMTMIGNIPHDGFDNDFDMIIVAQLFPQKKTPIYDYNGLVFPMVDLRQNVDISWLLGMRTTDSEGQPAIISQALQENRLRMNEIGARAQSAVAIGALRCLATPHPDHVIDRPFLVWFERPGVQRPLFAGHITEENWNNPGDIRQQ